MRSEALLANAVLILAVALAATLVLHRLRAPTLTGYVLTGLALGPDGLGLLHEGPGLELLAEIGVAFLMFHVGLEFSWPVLMRARRAVFGMGGTEVLLVSGLGAAAALGAGLAPLPALLVGGAVAMSSTAITMRQLAEQGELSSAHGRLAVGVLLFQDVAALPFLVLASTLGEREPEATLLAVLPDLGAALAAAAAAFAAACLLGRYALVQAVACVAATGSREHFMLAVLLLVLGAGWGAHALGLSLPLGAFLAGMILGETRFRHQAEEDVRPFRDALLGLFFVTVGMRIDPAVAARDWAAVLALLSGLTLLKGLAILILLRLFGEESATAARAAVTLAHGGEFGLLMLTSALGAGALSPPVGQPLLAATALSMVAAPFLIRHAGAMTAWIAPSDGPKRPAP